MHVSELQRQKLRIAITGGSGFIGRFAVGAALKNNFHVLNIDIADPKEPFADEERYILNILDTQGVSKALKQFRPTHILHLAAETDFAISEVEEFKTIIQGTKNLIDASLQIAEEPRFIHVSTQYVLQPGEPFVDHKTLHPYTPYGEAKSLSERLLWQSSLTKWSIVRPCMVYGPGFLPFADGIFKHMRLGTFRQPSSRSPVLKTWGYVDNIADQMIALALCQEATSYCRTYYVGDTVGEYDEWVDNFSIDISGKPAKRMGKSLLRAAGLVGELANKARLSFPYNLGRYRRMTTSSPYPIDDILAIAGAPAVNFETGRQNTVKWLAKYWDS